MIGAEIRSTHDKIGGLHSFHKSIFKTNHYTKQSGFPTGWNLWLNANEFPLPHCHQGSVKKLLTTLKDLQEPTFLICKFMEFECACDVHEYGWRTLLCWQRKTYLLANRNPIKASFPSQEIVMHQKQVNLIFFAYHESNAEILAFRWQDGRTLTEQPLRLGPIPHARPPGFSVLQPYRKAHRPAALDPRSCHWASGCFSSAGWAGRKDSDLDDLALVLAWL